MLKYILCLVVRGFGSRLRKRYCEEKDKKEIMSSDANIIKTLPLKVGIFIAIFYEDLNLHLCHGFKPPLSVHVYLRVLFELRF
jgi:hypothetical protein